MSIDRVGCHGLKKKKAEREREKEKDRFEQRVRDVIELEVFFVIRSRFYCHPFVSISKELELLTVPCFEVFIGGFSWSIQENELSLLLQPLPEN